MYLQNGCTNLHSRDMRLSVSLKLTNNKSLCQCKKKKKKKEGPRPLLFDYLM